MRRGLIAWSKAELPESVLDARVERAKALMADMRIDAIVIYTNHTAPAGVSWFTGFVPYWGDGLLVVPCNGRPILLVSLSRRVLGWIERTSRVGRVINTPRIGFEAGRATAATDAKAVVGVANLDILPAGIAEDFVEGGPNLTLVDGTAIVERLRAKADPTEVALGVKAGWIAHRALAQASSCHADSGATIGAVEGEARRLGAEEVYIAVAPDLERSRRLIRIEGTVPLGQAFALRTTIAYKGYWIRMTRTVARDREFAVATTAATERFAGAVSRLPSDLGFAGFSWWLVEGCRVAQPFAPLMGSMLQESLPLAAGSVVSVQAVYEIDGKPIVLGAPALIGSQGEAASLLIPPVFDDVA